MEVSGQGGMGCKLMVTSPNQQPNIKALHQTQGARLARVRVVCTLACIAL